MWAEHVKCECVIVWVCVLDVNTQWGYPFLSRCLNLSLCLFLSVFTFDFICNAPHTLTIQYSKGGTNLLQDTYSRGTQTANGHVAQIGSIILSLQFVHVNSLFVCEPEDRTQAWRGKRLQERVKSFTHISVRVQDSWATMSVPIEPCSTQLVTHSDGGRHTTHAHVRGTAVILGGADDRLVGGISTSVLFLLKE